MNGRLVRRIALTPAERASMFELFALCFSGVDRRSFERDLDEKNWVILLENDAGELRGFSTLLLYRTVSDGEPISIVYSGDTIVAPGSWGTSALPRNWIDSIWSLHRPGRDGRLLWLLLTSGFRTYRFLPLFWREFFPRHDQPTPQGLHRLIHTLATERFGRCYDSDAGVVRFPRPGPLAGGLSGIPASKLGDPHVAFFAQANPGYAHGDELVCLTELTEANLTAAGRRMVRAGRRRRAAEAAPP